jgi:hypothetical protein
MEFRIGTARDGDRRELFLAPGALLTAFERPEGWRCRLRRVRGPRPIGPDLDEGGLEALVEWLDERGARTGRLTYVALRELAPDAGERTCPAPRRSAAPRS